MICLQAAAIPHARIPKRKRRRGPFQLTHWTSANHDGVVYGPDRTCSVFRVYPRITNDDI